MKKHFIICAVAVFLFAAFNTGAVFADDLYMACNSNNGTCTTGYNYSFGYPTVTINANIGNCTWTSSNTTVLTVTPSSGSSSTVVKNPNVASSDWVWITASCLASGRSGPQTACLEFQTFCEKGKGAAGKACKIQEGRSGVKRILNGTRACIGTDNLTGMY